VALKPEDAAIFCNLGNAFYQNELEKRFIIRLAAQALPNQY
jgi:hypothetical protein